MGNTYLEVVESDTELLVTDNPTPAVVEVVAVGPQGPVGDQNLFIQDAAPTTSLLQYLWVQTGLGDGTDMTFWVAN